MTMMDFYFSPISEEKQKESQLDYNGKYISVEVEIDGAWKQFSEQITVGRKPVMKQFGDIIFLGTADNTNVRYTIHK